MYASSKVAALLLLVCPILLTNARPQNFETFFQQSGGNASELQQLKTAFKDVPKEVKANLALVFLSSFDLTSKQLEEKMVDALNGYQDAQNALKSMMTQAKQQKEQKFESYITALADSTKQQAAQNLLNNVVKNEDITLMDMCNQIMAYIGTLSAEDKALFIKTVHGGKGVPQGAGAPQGGPMALFGGSNTATDSSQNLCNKMEQWMEKMAGVLKERMSTSGNLAAPIANGAGTVQ